MSQPEIRKSAGVFLSGLVWWLFITRDEHISCLCLSLSPQGDVWTTAKCSVVAQDKRCLCSPEASGMFRLRDFKSATTIFQHFFHSNWKETKNERWQQSRSTFELSVIWKESTVGTFSEFGSDYHKRAFMQKLVFQDVPKEWLRQSSTGSTVALFKTMPQTSPHFLLFKT